jgi:hypothetical protein
VRQLSVKSSKQRRAKPPAPLEFSSHVFIADMLRRWCNPAWEWTHVPLGEKRHIATAKRLKRMGVRPGWPDFLFAGPNAKLVWLELKRRGNRLSEEQERIEEHLRACGFDYLVTDHVDEAISWLKGLGILPAKIRGLQ